MPSPAASARLKPAAAAVTGTLIRKEKRAASSRLRPKNSPQLIVAPERETPGTRAAACASPIPKAPNEPSFMALSVLGPTASATRNSAPTKMRFMTTTQGERTSVAKKSSKKNPISTPGADKGLAQALLQRDRHHNSPGLAHRLCQDPIYGREQPGDLGCG